jgi:hypothetical protein
MAIPLIFVDFMNADPEGRVRLSSVGTVEDLARLGVRLENGLHLTLHDEELEADGEVVYSADEKIWVAKIDWKAIRNISRPA